MKNRKMWIIAAVVVVIGIIFLVRYIQSKNVVQEDVVEIGAVLPLTGAASSIGQWQQKGLDLAAKDINNEGGIGGKPLQLVYQDSAGDPKTGISAFNQILSGKKPPVVITSISSVSNAILPDAQDQRVSVVMLAVSLPDITNKSEYAYRFNVGSEDEAEVMARFIATQKKLNRIAVYFINDEFGLGAVKTFKEEYGKYGGTISWQESYANDATEHRSTLSKIPPTGAQGVYVIGYTRASALAIKQLRELNIKLPVFANMALTVPSFTQLIGDALDGVYFTTNNFDVATDDPQVARFVQEYKQAYNETPTFFSAFAYDALRVIAESLKKQGPAPDDIKDFIAAQSKFTGVMGEFSVDAKRNFRFPVHLVEFKEGKLQKVSD